MLNKIKENIKSNDLNKKLITYGILIGVAFIILLLLLFFIKLLIGNRITPNQLESRLETSAIKYYEKKPELLPNNNGAKVKVTIDELVEAGTLKNLNKLLKKGYSCTGYVSVEKNNDFYSYIPYLDCGNEYKTKLLTDEITNSKNIVTSGNGLYQIGDSYIFKGENLNNNVKFDGKNWLIIRINNDKTIKLLLNDKTDSIVWDDRYNTSKEYEIGKNDYKISRIRDSINNYFKENFSNDAKALMIPMNLCIGSRKVTDKINDGSIECKTTLPNQALGLLQINEYMQASLESNCSSLDNYQCKNYNYLANLNSSFWSITSDSDTTYKVYKISDFPSLSNASSTAQMKVTTIIRSDIIFNKGDGSIDNPYIIK